MRCRHLARRAAALLLLLFSTAGNTCDRATKPIPIWGIAALSPANGLAPSTADWANYWIQVRGQGGLQGVHTDWDSSGEGNVPAAITYSVTSGFRPVVVLGVESALGNPSKITKLKTLLASLATQHTTAYLGLGNEIDTSPQFTEIAALVDELAAYVHSLGTTTQVFTVFQYEHLLDLPDAAQRLFSVPNVDFVAFTTYPFLRYATGASVPSDYYAPILGWGLSRIAFTEVGWPSRPQNGPAYPSLSGSEQDQLDFMRTFQAAVPDLSTIFANWFSLHDSAPWVDGEPVPDFEHVVISTGLIGYGDDTAKSALTTWLNRPEPLPD